MVADEEWDDQSTAMQVLRVSPSAEKRRWFLLVRSELIEPRVFELAPHVPVTVGRSPENNLVLDDTAVSRRHAAVALGERTPHLTDLDSRHGFVLNGVRQEPGTVVQLGDGDVVTLGNTALTVASAALAETPSRAPTAAQGFVVESEAMRTAYDLASRVARFTTSVVLNGETGVGKEVFASAIHNMSQRMQGPFVRLNCAAFPENLLESELFGHEKGAFTGADKRRIGYIEAAHGGTLFLDEIGEMPLSTQAKLLVVLESKKVVRVGSTTPNEVDVRYISATHRDLHHEIAQGRFREDLFYRLSSFVLMIPPLRQRAEEIPALCELFLGQFAKASGVTAPRVSAEAMRVLQSSTWPGNVRELKNALERAMVLARGEIQVEDLPQSVLNPTPKARNPVTPLSTAGSVSTDLKGDLQAIERQNVIAALQECGGNQTKAALKLGISRRALIHKMDKFGLR
jgi:two-component system, NtrC family, response regulator AtoC